MNQRREFLQLGLGLAVAGAVGSQAQAQSPSCRVTPIQPEGPFYPVDGKLGSDADLTRVKSGQPTAQGQVVYISGIIQDAQCRPIEGATVEIWQACATGRYDHPSDPNTAPLDPHFQYSGYSITNRAGEYMFKTIVPGAYPAGDGWIRPPHIHYKVYKLGYIELITQMYFAGQTLNDRDLILQRLSKAGQKQVIVDFAPPKASGFEPGALLGQFNVSLDRA
ncbi:MAG: hypothetical protein K2X47_18095 [Bdellovibrionales bacterium]|nr:hypothetical protein [Bdellovibrionales bacterium]